MMRAAFTLPVALCGALGLSLLTVTPASARCELIRATNSAATPRDAAIASQASAAATAKAIRAKHRWRYVSMHARKVAPDPFWKAVRPVVPPNILIKPDIVTAKTYTQCWPGVVVPYVCTSGAIACGG